MVAAAGQIMPGTAEGQWRMERYTRRVLVILTAGVVLGLLGHLAVLLWARHEFTQVESVVANHASSLAVGRGIYFRLKSYPYTVTAYTPLFYGAQAALHRLGMPILAAGRWMSFAALLGVIFLSRRLLQLYVSDRYCVWTGTLLVASTANLLVWGTVGQVDLAALFFALAAFYKYCQYHLAGEARQLWWAGLFLVLAGFTKQTMIASGTAILLSLALESRRRAAWLVCGVGGCAIPLALVLNFYTKGGFIESILWANLNPFRVSKLFAHLQYLAVAGGSLVVLALAGLRSARRAILHPFYIYLAAAAAVFAATSAKVGSDLNYQLETLTLLAICAGWTLQQVDFFPRCFRGDRSPATLLQIPVLLSIVMNLGITGKMLLGRLGGELLHREEYASLQPYLQAAQEPVISVELDPLVQRGRPFEIEPLIYTLLVGAGRIDPEPVRLDLARRRFPLVILYEDVFSARSGQRELETPSLPENQIEEIRKHYRLIRHIPGPFLDGAYLYQPARP